MKRITRDDHLTPEEAVNYNAIREEIEAEKPEINVHIRRCMAEKRKQKAAESNRPTLGQRIRTSCEALGQFQVNLAAAGISQGYLSQLETDEREPTLSIVAQLAKALNISFYELASGAA
jgi:ribosome-binding protein aMBF1 (putative translation factor)